MTDPRAFILANTRPVRPPHAPEIVLQLADEAVPLWKKTEEELEAIGLPPPFWAFAWAGGQALARYILDNPEIVRGRAVLDFASGSGLVAIAAMLAGARSALACDIDPYAAAAVQINAAANGVTVDFAGSDMVGEDVRADILLAGDVFYEKPFAERLVAWFGNLRATGKTVLIGDPGRSYLPKQHLTQLATYEIAVTRELEDSEVKRSCVWAFD